MARIDISSSAPVARLNLAHGRQNIIDFEMMDDLSRALADLEARADISTLFLSGAGAHFSAGVDIPSHTSDKVETMLRKFHEAIRRVVNSSKVTIAVVRGNCLGGGAELAMVCDLTLTAEDAVWGFPEIQLACYPPVAVAALAELVGRKFAAEMVLTGRTFNGREAERMGLVNCSFPEAKLDEAVGEYERQFASLSPAALAHAKRAMSSDFFVRLARSESMYIEELSKTEDAEEGIRAWMEKRKPEWKGK